MLNWLKVQAIRATDRMNQRHDPFEEFNRQAMPKTIETLADKEVAFYDDLRQNFLLRGGTIVNYRIPQDVRLPIDLGDQALWHGIATGIEAIKEYFTSRIVGPVRCAAYLLGMADQQPDGILIRGIDNARDPNLDASNDQATGHLFGLYFMGTYGPSALRESAAQLLGQWADNILAHDDCLINPDGKPTTYGRLVNGWATDPLRLTLCLAIYSAAYQLTGIGQFLRARDRLLDKYRELITYPKVRLWWIDKSYDTHRAAIHLAILAMTDADMPGVEAGLGRIREMVRKDGNIWVNALCRLGMDRTGAQYETMFRDRELALKVLSEFDVEAKRYNPGRDNANYSDRRFGPKIPFRKILWNGRWMASQPPPRWGVRSQDFFWQRNLRSLDEGTEYDPADSRYNGLDYLAAYWLCRLVGVLGDGD